MPPGAFDWEVSQRFRCSIRGCDEEQFLPEHPRTGPASVRAGCSGCEKLTRHIAVGRDPRWQAVVDAHADDNGGDHR